MKLRVWSVNRWLRWTGFRLFVGFQEPVDSGPTWIGLRWYGWGFVGHEPAAGRWQLVDGAWVDTWKDGES
jgi:hypothetical protein